MSGFVKPIWLPRTFQEKCSKYRQKQHRNIAEKVPLSSHIEGYILAVQEELLSVTSEAVLSRLQCLLYDLQYHE